MVRCRVKISLTEDLCIWLQTGKKLIPDLLQMSICVTNKEKRIKTLLKMSIIKLIFNEGIAKT